MGVRYSLVQVAESELNGFLRNPDLLIQRLEGGLSYEEPASLDIDKSWDGLRYILSKAETENASVLSEAVFISQIIDESHDFGYGPAQYWRAKQVQVISNELERIEEGDLVSLADGNKMIEEGIYPGGWDDPEAMESLFDHFKKWRAFYLVAAKNSQAIIAIMS